MQFEPGTSIAGHTSHVASRVVGKCTYAMNCRKLSLLFDPRAATAQAAAAFTRTSADANSLRKARNCDGCAVTMPRGAVRANDAVSPHATTASYLHHRTRALYPW